MPSSTSEVWDRVSLAFLKRRKYALLERKKGRGVAEKWERLTEIRGRQTGSTCKGPKEDKVDENEV